MSNIPLLDFQPQDVNGDIYPGAKLYTYITNTTTPKATYPTLTDRDALTNANANPIVADANGRFGRIYLLDDEDYTFVLKTTLGSTLWTKNNVRSLALSSSSVTTRLAQIASNPVDFGAIGDGVADESACVQDAIDAATGVVDLLGLTYRCDHQITLPSGVTLRNGKLNFASCADNEYIRIVGTRGGSVLLTGNVAPSGQSLALTSVAGLAAGDWLYLTSTSNYNGGTDNHGEVVQIRSIAALTVTLVERLIDAYTTAQGAYVQKLTCKSRVTLQDLQVTANASAAGTGRVIYAEIVDGLTLINVRVLYPKLAGIEVRAGINVTMLGCVVQGNQATGDGFVIAVHSRNVSLVQCRASCLVDGFTTGAVDANDGVCRFIDLQRFGAYGCTVGVAVGINSDLVSLDGEVVTGNTVYTNAGYRTRILGVADVISGNFAGGTFAGGGSGDGVDGTGGATGIGVKGTGGTTSGAGVRGVGGTDSSGVTAAGTGLGHGVDSTGGAQDAAIGVKGTGGGTNSVGVKGVGTGTAAGVVGTGGGTDAPGVDGTGGATNGIGVNGTGKGTAAGVQGTGAASTAGPGAKGIGGSSSGVGVYGVGGAANGRGVLGQGTGTGVGGYFLADTGQGYALVADGGATSAVGAFRIVPSTAPGGPNAIGDMYMSTAGILFVCTSAGSPGTWTKVGLQS